MSEPLDLDNEGEVKGEAMRDELLRNKADRMSDNFPETTHWDYRVVKEKDEYTIREVFYNGDTPHSWVDGYSYPAGEDGDELLQDMDHFDEAMARPVIVVDGDEYLGTEPALDGPEGIEMHFGFSIAGAVIMFLAIVGVWETLKAFVLWVF